MQAILEARSSPGHVGFLPDRNWEDLKKPADGRSLRHIGLLEATFQRRDSFHKAKHLGYLFYVCPPSRNSNTSSLSDNCQHFKPFWHQRVCTLENHTLTVRQTLVPKSDPTSLWSTFSYIGYTFERVETAAWVQGGNHPNELLKGRPLAQANTPRIYTSLNLVQLYRMMHPKSENQQLPCKTKIIWIYSMLLYTYAQEQGYR